MSECRCGWHYSSDTDQPVIQDANAAFSLGANIAAQKYGPPLVGIADTISAMPRPTNMADSFQQETILWEGYLHELKKLTMIQPTDMTPGPPMVRPYSKRLEAEKRQSDCQQLQSLRTYVVIPVTTL